MSTDRTNRPRSTLFQRAGTARADASASGAQSSEAVAAMERENDEVLKALRQDVRSLRGISGTINTEVGHHIKLLDSLQTTMDAARTGLKHTMRKLDDVTGSSGMGHIWLLLIFAFCVLFFVFLLLKFR
jgi:hypothetical protein